MDTAAGLTIECGTCYALFAYDVGFAIDLDKAEQCIAAASTQRGKMPRKRRAPHYFEYHPAPLRITQPVETVRVGGHDTLGTVDAVIFDFGAISLTYSIPLSGPLSGLLTLSDELWDHPQLLSAARKVVEHLQAALSPAITKPRISNLVEDYAIFQINQTATGDNPEDIISNHRLPLAQILRAEPETLSEQEIKDAMSCRMSYGTNDCVLIDWNAALVFDRDAEDVRAVLEFANVELLALRYLDDQLDSDLDEAYETVTRRRLHLPTFLGSREKDLRRIAALQMDSALLFEGVNNALKLLGDQYLARLYRMASQRLHLTEWDASIIRKLQILKDLYERMSDQQSNQRLEVLEWIIIILIAFEILLTLVPGIAGH